MHTYEANRTAVGGRTQAVRRALKRLGMRRCSEALVERQWKPPVPGISISWYCSFWRWFEALWIANRSGAEFLFEDFRSRVLALRAEDDLAAADWYEELSNCEREHSEAVQAAILNRDYQRIKVEISEAITALRKLRAIVEAREQKQQEQCARAA